MITEIIRADGKLVIVDADEADGLPPPHLIDGGDGYIGARTFVWRKVDTGRSRQWRLVEARGWNPEA